MTGLVDPRLRAAVDSSLAWYEDVFGDLEFIEAGSDALVNAFAGELLDETRLGAEVRSMPSPRSATPVCCGHLDNHRRGTPA